MAKLTLTTIASGYYTVEQLNTNFAAIVAAVEKQLSRDGTAPNAMSTHIDMGGYNILNVGNITSASTVVATDTTLFDGKASSLYCQKANDETVAGAWTFSQAPSFPAGTIARQDTTQKFTAAVQMKENTLASSASVTPDASLGNCFKLTTSASFTLNDPTNAPLAGYSMTLTIRVTQGGAGSHVITWGSGYKFPAGAAPTLSTAVGAVDLISCEYDSASGTWMTVVSKGIA